MVDILHTERFSVIGGILYTILMYVVSIHDQRKKIDVTKENFCEVYPIFSALSERDQSELRSAIESLRFFGRQVLDDDELWKRLPDRVSDGQKLVSKQSMKNDLAREYGK